MHSKADCHAEDAEPEVLRLAAHPKGVRQASNE
jgi:hypothetical protein